MEIKDNWVLRLYRVLKTLILIFIFLVSIVGSIDKTRHTFETSQKRYSFETNYNPNLFINNPFDKKQVPCAEPHNLDIDMIFHDLFDLFPTHILSETEESNCTELVQNPSVFGYDMKTPLRDISYYYGPVYSKITLRIALTLALIILITFIGWLIFYIGFKIACYIIYGTSKVTFSKSPNNRP